MYDVHSRDKVFVLLSDTETRYPVMFVKCVNLDSAEMVLSKVNRGYGCLTGKIVSSRYAKNSPLETINHHEFLERYYDYG